MILNRMLALVTKLDETSPQGVYYEAVIMEYNAAKDEFWGIFCGG